MDAALVASATSTHLVLLSLLNLPSGWSYLKMYGLESVKENEGIQSKQFDSPIFLFPKISNNAFFNSLLSCLPPHPNCLKIS